MKHLNDTIGNRTRDLQVYSTVLNEQIDIFLFQNGHFFFEKMNFGYRIVSVAMNVTDLVTIFLLCLTFVYFQILYSLFIYYWRH